jgi:hypothetical protein
MRPAMIALLVSFALPAWAVDCPAPMTACGTMHCTPANQVCCASVGHEELSCPMGTACQTDGSCKAVCTGGGINTVATCGGDTCGCSAPCKRAEDCESRCCTTAGYCAPACVCNGAGRLFLECNLGGVGFEGMAKSSCEVVPDANASAWPVILMAGSIVLLRRRRLS